jgi:mannonate dehydratase
MDRRSFFTKSGIGVLAVAATAGATSACAAAPAARQIPSHPIRMKLGCQSGPSTDEHFAYFARYGVNNICAARMGAREANLDPVISVQELSQLKEMAEKHGLSLDMIAAPFLESSHIDRERRPSIMLGDRDQRDRDIDAIIQTMRNCAEVGIPAMKYNMSILGVLRTERSQGRGDSSYSTWKLDEAVPTTPLTRAGVVNADAFWERITYFLDRVAPVAAELKVKIACHPHDPGVPPEGYQGVDRVLGTVEGLKRFVSIQDNAYHGLNFCQGTVSEMLANPGEEIFDVIRWFGERKKLFNVHFRNIRGRRDDFSETFPDEGDIDFVRALRVYHEVDYDGMLMPDHVPTATNDPRGLQSFAFAYGHTRGLLQSLQSLQA